MILKRSIASLIFLSSIIFIGFLLFNIVDNDVQIREILTFEDEKKTKIVLNSPVVERFNKDSMKILNDEYIKSYIGFSALFEAKLGWSLSKHENRDRCGNEPIYFNLVNEEKVEVIQISVYDRTHDLKILFEDCDIVFNPKNYSKRDRSKMFVPQPLNCAEIVLQNYDELVYTYSQGINDLVYGYGQKLKIEDGQYKLNYNVITFNKDFFVHFGCYNVNEFNKETIINEMHEMLGTVELKKHLL